MLAGAFALESLCLVGLSLVAAPPGQSAPVPELEHFPAFAGGANAAAGLLAVDLEGDGAVEIIAVAGEGVTVMDASGAVRVGFPVALASAAERGRLGFSTAPLACDVDGDERLEIVLAGDNKKIYALSARGAPVQGFPVALPGVPRGSVTCAALGPHEPVLLLTTNDGGLYRVDLKKSAGVAPALRPTLTLLANIGPGAESGVAVADLDGDGKPEVVAVGGDGHVYIVSLQGVGRARLDYTMAFRASGVPAIGDINDDGLPEIVVGSQDFKIHALGAKGASLPGFPVETAYRLYGSPALVDLDGDGVLDVVIGSGDGKLYAVTGQGHAIKGFPLTLDGRIVADVVAADFDKDGAAEIAAVTQAGSLYVVSAAGKIASGFPLRLGGKPEAAPAAADIDRDGMLELVAESPNGQVHAWRSKTSGKAERALAAWPMSGHDAQHSGRFAPSEARLRDLGFVNPEPRTTDALEVAYRYFDFDGDPEGHTQLRWFLENKRVPELDNQRRVPPERTKKHQHWHYTAQGADNFASYGESGVLSRVVVSPVVEVRNTPPHEPAIEVTPASPRTSEPIVVRVTRPSTDDDGDAVAYRYTWLVDGRPQKLPLSRTRIEAAETKKHEQWRVVAVPFDGEQEGESASAVVVVRNTPPLAAKIALSPSAPKIDDEVRVLITTSAPDDDGDVPTYDYRYSVNGVSLALPHAVGSVPPRTLRKHDVLRVQVVAADDEEVGGVTEASLTCVDTAPLAPTVSLWPSQAGTKDALLVAVTSEPADADRDAVVLRLAWSVDGHRADFGTLVPADATSKGQLWRVEATPFDGELAGPSVSAATRIVNSPPRPPVLALDRYEYFTDEDVVPRIVLAAEDDDGDPVRLRYLWLANGKRRAALDDTPQLPASESRKGDAWELVVTPNDGETDGGSVRLAWHIKNSPPGAALVRLTPARPTVRDALAAVIATAAVDTDGDALVYRYRWYRDGVAREEWPGDKSTLLAGEAKKGEHWRVEVRAFDGSELGPAALAEVTMVNHRPLAPEIAVVPAAPRVDEPLVCLVKKAALDPDGDPLTYRRRWLVDGRSVPWAPGVEALAPTLTRKHERWSCEVEASDGREWSETARALAVMVLNTPPSTPKISITPAEPATGDDLTCELATPAFDADADAVRYRFAWTQNGKAWPAASSSSSKANANANADVAAASLRPANRVPAAATERGQVWECVVVPTDGEADGVGASARVRIVNTPPRPPQVAVSPARPRAGEQLTCAIVKAATDADGDAVHYRYAWQKDGAPQAFAPISATVPARLVKAGDLWRCSAAALDATESSATVESADVVVGPIAAGAASVATEKSRAEQGKK